MQNRTLRISLLLASLLSPLMFAGCNDHVDAAAEAPPPPNVVQDVDLNLFAVDHPDQFPLAEAAAHPTTSELVVTGTVTPDVSRNVPVVSLASGASSPFTRDSATPSRKVSCLLTIRSDDVAGGFDAYRKAVTDELLARKQLNRAVGPLRPRRHRRARPRGRARRSR
jgi:cobalt-zinc-cadmium efflux system membrane fusion protein